MLDINIPNIIFVAALVWFLMTILNKIYYKPVGQVMEDRESKINRESNQIESMTHDIEEKTQHIEKVLRDAKKESTRIREELIKKGEEVRGQIITHARDNSKKMFETSMEQLDKEIAAAEKKLEQEIDVFSDRIKEIFI